MEDYRYDTKNGMFFKWNNNKQVYMFVMRFPTDTVKTIGEATGRFIAHKTGVEYKTHECACSESCGCSSECTCS